MLNTKPLFFIFTLITLLLGGCFDEAYEEISQKRAKLAENVEEPITIGIVWDSHHASFLKGVHLAVKQINAEGGILNRPLKIIINMDEDKLLDPKLSTDEYQSIVLDIANSFADNHNVIAVIGHVTSKAALLASVIYENNGLLFLAPSATNIKLTGHQFNYIFRTIPNNDQMGISIADYLAEKNFSKIAVLNSRSAYATELSDVFSSHLMKNKNASILFRQSFFENTVDITSLVVSLKKISEIEAIFIASTDLFAKEIYQKTRDMGIRVPFVAGDTLNMPPFLEMVKVWENSKNVKKTIIPSLFNPLLAENQKVITLFKQEYGKEFEPDEFSALGYDNIMLLAHAIKRTQSTIPIRIANMLRHMPPCQGLTGQYHFTKHGDLTDKDSYFKEFHQGKYEYRQIKTAEVALPQVLETCNEIDRDKDSIPNDIDTCPDNSAEEISKGIFLTGLRRGCPVDKDNDKIPDYSDQCPDNSLKEISKGVNELGCPLDSDADGKADYEDLCPLNPELTGYVKGKNCTKDKDKDGITDDIDQCPNNTKEEIIKGVNKTGKGQGCPVDNDGDNIVDYIDSCPHNNQLEISQGVDAQGCPADNDRDSIIDYEDKCLNTPDSVIIDSQGCGIIENSIILHPLNFYFESGQNTLTSTGKAYLEAFIGQIKPNNLKQIKIIIHTDSEVSSEKNLVLSEEQALTINEYFQQQNINCEKITSEGKGNNLPITDSTKTKKDEVNQRVELISVQFKSK